MDAYPAIQQQYITPEKLSPPEVVQRLDASQLKDLRKSPLERMVAQAGASPKTENGKTDYPNLIRQAIEAYNSEKGKDIYKNSDMILSRLSGPLGQLISADPTAIPANTKVELGEAFGLYGVLLRDVRKDIQGARVHYEKAIALNPRNHKALTNLATLHFLHTGDLEAARTYIGMAYEIRPDDPVIKSWHRKISPKS